MKLKGEDWLQETRGAEMIMLANRLRVIYECEDKEARFLAVVICYAHALAHEGYHDLAEAMVMQSLQMIMLWGVPMSRLDRMMDIVSEEMPLHCERLGQAAEKAGVESVHSETAPHLKVVPIKGGIPELMRFLKALHPADGDESPDDKITKH